MRTQPARTLALSTFALAAAVALVAIAGCGPTKEPSKITPPQKYTVIEPRPVPEWLKGSIMEQVDLTATEPFRVSNFGLVVLKKPTGDASNIPASVREYMIREMTKRRFGSKNQPGFENLSPETVLRDPRVAVVRVDCFIPPGASVNQRVDAYVSAMPDSNTTSLAGGALYTTDLVKNGANVKNPGMGIETLANARGYVFVNPSYALETGASEDAAQRRGLTSGMILNGGRVNQDRPIGLRVRAAESRLSRMTERRINQLFNSLDLASAKDEAQVFVRMPPKYRGDWEHFAGVMLHTFYQADSVFAVAKAKELAAEAVKPDSEKTMLDISYAIESLGKPAIPQVESLLYHPRPEVSYAVARAVAWIGDGAAEAALVSIARDANNPFRVRAVETLASLPMTPAINMTLRELINAPDALVRIEAYKGLVRNDATSAVYSKTIGDKFIIDIIESEGPPLIYATRSGNARLAFIGSPSKLLTPAFFTAMNDELSISDDTENKSLLSIFYRGDKGAPVRQLTSPDIAEIAARLGGEGMPGQPRLDFSYGEIVALLGRLADDKLLVAANDRSKAASFVLQTAPGAERAIDAAPVIPDGPRPVDTPEASSPSASVR